MSIVLPALAVAFAAFCIWLAVRIVNRRERWAKRTAVIMVALAYPLSFGPACWYAERCVENTGRAPPPWLGVPYYPLGQLAAHGPAVIRVPLRAYAAGAIPKRRYLYLPLHWRKWDISSTGR